MRKFIGFFCLLAAGLFCSSAMANSYYASLTTKVARTGGGKVYAAKSNKEDATQYSATGNGAVQSDKTETSGGNVTLYAFAQADEGYEFKGWATSESGATSYASTANPWAASLAASTTKDGIQAYTYYAYFDKISLPSFSVTFLAPQNGSYTVDGTTVGSGGRMEGRVI